MTDTTAAVPPLSPARLEEIQKRHDTDEREGKLRDIGPRVSNCASDRAALLDEVTRLQGEAGVLIDRLRTFIHSYNTAMEEDDPKAVTESVLAQILSNLPSAGQALLEERDRLRANQRTPGTVEKCGLCGHYESTPGTQISGCGKESCPIRKSHTRAAP